jgi:hypothetical protein
VATTIDKMLLWCNVAAISNLRKIPDNNAINSEKKVE